MRNPEVYSNTVLVFEADPSRAVDLRREVRQRERAFLASLGLDRPFAVLTGHNPGGRVAAGNDERQELLEALLRREGDPVVRVDGCSPDLRHREASLAAPISEARAHEIAEEFEQDAFFWYDGERFYLVGAGADDQRFALPLRPVENRQSRDYSE